MVEVFPNKNNVKIFTDNVIQEKIIDLSVVGYDPLELNKYIPYMEYMQKVRLEPTIKNIKIALSVLAKEQLRPNQTSNEEVLISWLTSEMEFYKAEIQKITTNITYTLRYKKDTYTLEEARAEIEKKDTSNEEFIVSMDGIK